MRFRFPTLQHACWAVLFILGCWRPGAYAQTASPTDDFANKSIEELMNIDVTSVSRKEQKLSKIPAAVYVITREAIQRSGEGSGLKTGGGTTIAYGIGATPASTIIGLPLTNMAWSIIGQNLLQARHQEFVNSEHGVQSLAERSIFGRIVWSF